MTNRKVAFAAAVAALSIPAAADARTQMRAVGSSTVYPFAKVVAERIARANPRLGTPIIESTGTGAGMKLFCAGVGERFPDVENASRRMKASEAKLCAAQPIRLCQRERVVGKFFFCSGFCYPRPGKPAVDLP